MDQKLFIPIILGTVRQGRQSEKVAKVLHSRMQQDERIETVLIDPRNLEIPMTDEGEALKEKNADYIAAVTKADGLVIVAPEYNHGYPGSLKRTLDMALKEYIHKAVGLVGVSKSAFGGTRVVEALLPVMRELGLVASFESLYFGSVKEIFDAEGNLLEEKYQERITKFLNELVWLSQVLRWGRNNLTS